MSINEAINAVKRRSESICQILFYVVSALCFIYYVGDFNGGFMPVMGTLLSMVIEVGLWLLIPVLLSIRRRSIAKWAFLGISIYWALTTIFSLLQGAGLATAFASSLSCATGVFSFLVACAMIVVSIFGVLAYWKKDTKMKLIAICIFIGTLVFYLVFFALRVALGAAWNDPWNAYFALIYEYLVIPFAMLFAALAFWFEEGELYFAVFDKSVAEKADASESLPEAEEVEEESEPENDEAEASEDGSSEDGDAKTEEGDE